MLLISFWIFFSIILVGGIAFTYCTGEPAFLLLTICFLFFNWIGHEMGAVFRNHVVLDGPVTNYIVEENPYAVIYHVKSANGGIAQSIKVDDFEFYNAHQAGKITINKYHTTTLFNSVHNEFYRAEITK